MRTLLLLCGCAAAAANFQVHTAFGKTEDALTVAWATNSSEGDSEVMWGLAAANLTQRAAGDMRPFTVDAGREWQTRMATMTGLDVGQTYYYKVGDSVNGYSDVFSVVNRKQPEGDAPYYHVLYGDMGSTAAFALCSACTEESLVCEATTCAQNTSVGLVSEVDKAGMFLHAGDFAYNLGHENGTVGDHFMRNIEQVAARVPYMVSHGNHEDKTNDIAHYIERFRSQPVNSFPAEYETANGVAPNTLYFSWNYGMVHYVSFSTELWIDLVANYSTTVTKDTFLEWLEADLQKANLPENRKAYPWIVVHGHRPLYGCQDNGCPESDIIRAALEPIYYKHGVSFSVNGHRHHYERSWPTYANKTQLNYEDPQATVYLVTGAAGSHEMHNPFDTPPASWSAFRSNTFGYTRMLVHNATHIHLQQVRTDPTTFPLSGYGDVIDDLWVVQHNQGPFDPTRAPQGTEVRSASHDHFDPLLRPLLGVPESDLPLHDLIAAYRKNQGEVAWARRLQELLARLNGAEWEDDVLDAKERAALKWVGSEP